jgi:hypothetical protein
VIYFLLFPAKADSYLERKINKFISNYNQPIGEYYKFPERVGDYLTVLKQLTEEYNETEHLLGLVQKEQMGFYHKLLGLG